MGTGVHSRSSSPRAGDFPHKGIPQDRVFCSLMNVVWKVLKSLVTSTTCSICCWYFMRIVRTPSPSPIASKDMAYPLVVEGST